METPAPHGATHHEAHDAAAWDHWDPVRPWPDGPEAAEGSTWDDADFDDGWRGARAAEKVPAGASDAAPNTAPLSGRTARPEHEPRVSRRDAEGGRVAAALNRPEAALVALIVGRFGACPQGAVERIAVLTGRYTGTAVRRAIHALGDTGVLRRLSLSTGAEVPRGGAAGVALALAPGRAWASWWTAGLDRALSREWERDARPAWVAACLGWRDGGGFRLGVRVYAPGARRNRPLLPTPGAPAAQVLGRAAVSAWIVTELTKGRYLGGGHAWLVRAGWLSGGSVTGDAYTEPTLPAFGLWGGGDHVRPVLLVGSGWTPAVDVADVLARIGVPAGLGPRLVGATSSGQERARLRRFLIPHGAERVALAVLPSGPGVALHQLAAETTRALDGLSDRLLAARTAARSTPLWSGADAVAAQARRGADALYDAVLGLGMG